MAVFTAKQSGKASEAATWDKGAETPGATSELVIAGSFEVKFETALTVIGIKASEKAKLTLTKPVTVTGTGHAFEVGSEVGTSVSGTGRWLMAVAGGSTSEPLTNGADIKAITFQGGATSKYKLASALVATSGFLHKAGALTTENFNITASGISFEAETAKELKLGTSTLKLTGPTSWNAGTGFGLTLSAASATIECTGEETTFLAEGFTYGTVTFTGKRVLVGGSGTFTTLNATLTGATPLFQVEATKTLTVVNLTAAEGVKLASETAGSPFKLKKTSGTLTLEGVKIKDCTAEGGATFVDRNGEDLGGNTGWTFETVASSAAQVMVV